MNRKPGFLFFLLVLAACNGSHTTIDTPLSGSHEQPSDTGLSVVMRIKASGCITVGGNQANICGFTSAAIQTAIDALHMNGGGTVKLLPGTYDIIAPVKLYSNINLTGSGPKTILKKCKGFRSGFTLDADYGEIVISVADPSGFVPGMGIQVYDSEQRYGWDATTAIITAIKGSTLYIDSYLLRDYRADLEGTVSNSCSVISAVEAENISISNLTVDGNRAFNDPQDGCRGGGIYLHKVAHATVENVLVKDFANDGISWQTTEYVTVRNCEIKGCLNAGLHPGTGSPYTLIEGNNSHHNEGYGLFICWRVQNGMVRNNSFHHNGQNGICTGHKDTDMVFEGNRITENASDGVNFRGESSSNAPHRNLFRNNLVENNGTRNGGYGFSFNSPAEGVILEKNIIRNGKGGKQLAAVYMYASAKPVTFRDNQVTGHVQMDIVYEKVTLEKQDGKTK